MAAFDKILSGIAGMDEALDFIRGGSSTSVKVLTEKMNEAAENLEFELAARLRDRINAIGKLKERQKVVASRVEEQDVFALAQGETHTAFEVFRFTGSKLSDRESFLTEGGQPDAEARSEFLRQYYAIRDRVPPLVVVDGEVEDEELIARWLTEKRGRAVKLLIPQRGDQYQLVQMCRSNAAESLSQHMGNSGREASALDELRRLLGLEKTPAYIESYDISNLQGGENVAGMGGFENGRPLKSAYRKFKIKTVSGQDDYGSMREVLTRRFTHGINEASQLREKGVDEAYGSFTRFPDLIMMDGGRGQVNIALEVLEELKLDIPVCGMVKDDNHRTRGLYYNNVEVPIDKHSEGFRLITRIQDEAHRFAIEYHRALRGKGQVKSILDDIPDIGPTRRKALMRQFKAIEAVKDATVEELESAPGMNRKAAESVYNFFH